MHQAQQHHQSLLNQPLDAATQARLLASVGESLAQHRELEAQPQGQFEDFVAAYYA
jgi:glutamate--cysteine ligase